MRLLSSTGANLSLTPHARAASALAAASTEGEVVEVGGVVQKVWFKSTETGYAVLRLRADSPRGAEAITVVGTLAHVAEGQALQLQGSWKRHPQYGRQLAVSEAVQVAPRSDAELALYLASGVLPGVGQVTAKALVETFGVEIESVLSAPDAVARLRRCPGVGAAKAARIKAAWDALGGSRAGFLFAKGAGVPALVAQALAEELGSGVEAALRCDPYAALSGRGLGLARLDAVAARLACRRDLASRAGAGTLECLGAAANAEGHSYLPWRDLQAATLRTLGGSGGEPCASGALAAVVADLAAPLAADAVLVDEASMLSLPLAAALMQALPPTCQLVLVGDVDQLPSIGPGTVLNCILTSGLVPVTDLRQVFRQAATSAIVGAALAGLLNPGGPDAVGGGSGAAQSHGLRPGDRVMQLVNDYDREVFNGDQGTVVSWDPAGKVVKVQFPHLVEAAAAERAEAPASFAARAGANPAPDGVCSYQGSEAGALGLAYAITVHKAQGGEAPCVVLVLAPGHGRMLDRRLVYTALTRAKKLLVVVQASRPGEPSPLELAVQRREVGTRHSGLGDRLAALGGDARRHTPDVHHGGRSLEIEALAEGKAGDGRGHGPESPSRDCQPLGLDPVQERPGTEERPPF
ncbi:hypothetical protein APUTEX25_002965 [Auxenochlorella protothecoides]|uniref:ATP-dependent RecD-like DNA helicase n=1 Tax=Auxenochlorella protothecoides TaxID=3075 RepID=A0A3M7L5V2_AUXPR|nr:hypothetical protein APUTEX25_002965 [Auxenochlorella protothecoides]|eukprot:RMZ56876.1 hypothetical protein APUTEX25_002965 [Auxenochlorella protothecoides]